MLSKLTVANAEGADVVLHEDTAASRRVLVSAVGLVGTGPLRESKRPLPTAHGSINETTYEEGRQIHLVGEVWSQVSIEAALEEFRKVSGVLLQTLDNGPALMKWTEGTAGLKLQMKVSLDSECLPTLQEAAGFLQYPVSLFAEDPRAYAQALTTQTGSTITGVAAESAFVTATTLGTGIAIDGTFIYFAVTGGIGRCKVGGTGLEAKWLTLAVTPAAVAVDAGHVYWTSNKGVGRATIAGATVEEAWVTKAAIGSQPTAVAVDSGHVYWGTQTTGGTGVIGRATIAGATVEKEWLTFPAEAICEVLGLAVDASFIYFCNSIPGSNAIGRATIGGATIEPAWITSPGMNPTWLTVSATFIYWSDEEGGRLGRAKINGTEAVPSFISGLVRPEGLAVNSEHLYWCESTTAVARGSLTGGPTGGAITVAQAGNRPTPIVFKIHGPILNPSITRASDGAQLVLKGAIGSGNYVEVNTADRTMMLNGTVNALGMLVSTQSDWNAFAAPPSPGSGTYTLAGTTATAAFMEAITRAAYA